MIASNNPARKSLWEFQVQRISEDNTHLLALSLCEYFRFTIIAPNQVPSDVHLGRVTGVLGCERTQGEMLGIFG